MQTLLDIRDTMEPMQIPEAPLSLWIIAGSAALALLLAFAVWRLTRKRRHRAKCGEAPEKAAWRRLSQLPAAGGRALYGELSAVLAEYLAARFAIDITHSTSQEVWRELPGRIALNHDAALALGRFLDVCDRGKFAPDGDLTAEAAITACQDVIRHLAGCSLSAPSPEGALHAAV